MIINSREELKRREKLRLKRVTEFKGFDKELYKKIKQLIRDGKQSTLITERGFKK